MPAFPRMLWMPMACRWCTTRCGWLGTHVCAFKQGKGTDVCAFKQGFLEAAGRLWLPGAMEPALGVAVPWSLRCVWQTEPWLMAAAALFAARLMHTSWERPPPPACHRGRLPSGACKLGAPDSCTTMLAGPCLVPAAGGDCRVLEGQAWRAGLALDQVCGHQR